MNPKDQTPSNSDAQGAQPPSNAPAQPPICCNCEKSRCLKLYCECFSRNVLCNKGCNCRDCLNNTQNYVDSTELPDPGHPAHPRKKPERVHPQDRRGRVGQQHLGEEGVHVQEVELPEKVLRVLREGGVLLVLLQVHRVL